MPCKGKVGLLGATSLVGECLLPLLVAEGWEVVAFSRRKEYADQPGDDRFHRRLLDESVLAGRNQQIPFWISLAPVFVLPDYFQMLSSCGAKRIVAVSSTSMFTKDHSSDPAEIRLARHLASGEERLIVWAGKGNVVFTILRPTMIYGLGRDKTISVITSFIRRFSFFCIFGGARGLRQPLHAQDMAAACLAALNAQSSVNKCYNISGGETLTYREMVCRIFSALGKKPRLIKFPLWLFRLGISAMRIFPRFRHWSAAMAQRMNQDMVFDHAEAIRDLVFSPRTFQPRREDLPVR